MAYTQSDLDKLEMALARGEKKVTYDNKSVEYFSHEELIQRINYVKKQLKKSKSPLDCQFKFTHSKGL